jgi:ribosomal-protein-alanine N-acetyltransferase
MHIHNLAVDPARQGRGLGRTLLALSLAVGARRGAERALLEVRQSNWAAQRLYRSLGFQGVAVRHGYYSHPAEDALILEKRDLSAGVRGLA